MFTKRERGLNFCKLAHYRHFDTLCLFFFFFFNSTAALLDEYNHVFEERPLVTIVYFCKSAEVQITLRLAIMNEISFSDINIRIN